MVSDSGERKKELDHIRCELQVNGYPDLMLGERREEVNETEQLGRKEKVQHQQYQTRIETHNKLKGGESSQ